jgi:hypothetical protein
MQEIKTINLKGREYAPVGERVKAFHEAFKEGTSILTDVEFKEGWAYVKATVSFEEKVFTGHSFGKLGTEKALEKLETVAVGRALAFAGFAPDGSIASYEEIERFSEHNPDVI